jgi:hypothetical protein
MTDRDDQQWLDALAGKPDANADAVTNAQAQALRTAMVARRAALEQATANAAPEEFERLRARLQREGLLTDSKAGASTSTQPSPTHWLGKLLGKWLPSAGGGSFAIPLLSLAANVVLGVAVVVQMGLFNTAPNTDAAALDYLQSQLNGNGPNVAEGVAVITLRKVGQQPAMGNK